MDMKISQMYHSNNLLYVYFYFLYELLLGRPKLYWSKILLNIIYIYKYYMGNKITHVYVYAYDLTAIYICIYREIQIQISLYISLQNKSNSLGIKIFSWKLLHEILFLYNHNSWRVYFVALGLDVNKRCWIYK